MLSTSSEDRPLGVQILGCEEKYIVRALEVLKDYKFSLLDFNAACPAKKVVRRGEGAGLMREPKKLQKILKLVVKNTALPVTVKIRSGWDEKSLNAREVALCAQDCGISALFIHGRTKMQGYAGAVNYALIRAVKKALKVPVIASGDILSGPLAVRMFEETGCDGICVARGALGNPWIFPQIEAYLKKHKPARFPSKAEIVRVMLEHLRACIDFYGEKNGVMIFRKFFCWYTKGFRKIRPLREKSSRVKTVKEMAAIIGSCAAKSFDAPRDFDRIEIVE
jgi:tRNA-dihydrouridine synthase B